LEIDSKDLDILSSKKNLYQFTTTTAGKYKIETRKTNDADNFDTKIVFTAPTYLVGQGNEDSGTSFITNKYAKTDAIELKASTTYNFNVQMYGVWNGRNWLGDGSYDIRVFKYTAADVKAEYLTWVEAAQTIEDKLDALDQELKRMEQKKEDLEENASI
jgi:hypothetical protein